MCKLNPTLPQNIKSFNKSTISISVGSINKKNIISAGRSFTINFKRTDGTTASTIVPFKELENQFKLLSKTCDDKKSIKKIYIKLKTANQDADRILKKQTYWYQFKTWFHRLSNLFKQNHDVRLNQILIDKNIKIKETDIQPWYDYLIHRMPNVTSLCCFTDSLQSLGEKVKNRYQELTSLHPKLSLMSTNIAGRNPPTAMLSFTMQGLAIIGSYLKEKHHVEHFYVCDSMEAFQAQLKKLADGPDCKASFVIPTRDMGVNARRIPENQHKTAVCIEKIDGQIKIALIEGEPKGITEHILKLNPDQLKTLKQPRDDTSVIWCIYKSGIDLNNVKLYRSISKREFGAYGCETIALRDAIDFLKTPDFFSTVQYHKLPINPNIQEIVALPPAFMKSTQSKTALQQYFKNNPSLANQSYQKSRSGSATLSETVNRNTFPGYDSKGKLKMQNHYVSFRSFKYHMMALQAMEDLSSYELEKIINNTLITVDRSSADINTLHYYFKNHW